MIRIRTLYKDTGDKISIILSSTCLFPQFFPDFIYLGNIYISLLIGILIVNLYLSKTNIKISFADIVILLLLIYLFMQALYSGQLYPLWYKYLSLLISIIYLKLNYTLYTKHLLFSKYVAATAIALFNFIFALKIIICQNSGIYLIEKYFDNTGIYSIFSALSSVILLSILKPSKLKYSKYISFAIVITTMVVIWIGKSRSAFLLISSYFVLEYFKSSSSCINKYAVTSILLVSLCVISAFGVKNESTQVTHLLSLRRCIQRQ